MPTNTNIIKVGLIGAGIQASRSPLLHEVEAQASGLSLSYQLIDLEHLSAGIEALPDLLSAAQQQGFAGVNITHPCKQAVIPLLDELSADAATIGAVNTVVFKDGRRLGHNTDCVGFSEGFRRGLSNAPLDQVVLIGAGGGGSAVAVAALQLGVKHLRLHDSDSERVTLLVNRLRNYFDAERMEIVTDLVTTMASVDGLIQATPVGMLAYPGTPLPLDLLQPCHWVAEIIYFPLETELLRYAHAIGCRTVNGGGMAVFQAVKAFQLFTNVTPDAERMLRHFAAMGSDVQHNGHKQS